MITEFLECLFKPNERMTDFQMRKTGVFTATVGIILMIVPYLLIVVGNPGHKSEYAQFLPMALFVVGIFYGLGVHRIIWGNTSGNSLYLSWGKGLASVAATIVSIMLSFFVVGLFAGYIKVLLNDVRTQEGSVLDMRQRRRTKAQQGRSSGLKTAAVLSQRVRLVWRVSLKRQQLDCGGQAVTWRWKSSTDLDSGNR